MKSSHCYLRKERAAIFVAAIMPMSVWPLSGAVIGHPWLALAWALCCAVLLATFPSRGLRISLWTQTLVFPFSLVWMGSVAVTGYGPSNAAMSALSVDAFREMSTAYWLGVAQPSFLTAALLSTCALIWAWIIIAGRTTPTRRQDTIFSSIFLLALLPASAINMNGTALQSFSNISASEVRNTVVWFSHIGIFKEVIAQGFDTMARGSSRNATVRSAKSAARRFRAVDGLAVFIIGESLRADALMVERRGPWSEALAKRLKLGLGIRFSDACAGGNATYTSVPRLLTAVDPTDGVGAAQNPTILAVAKAAGAKTAYIMNHESWVVPESGHDFIEKTSSMEHPAFDDEVVVALEGFLQRSGMGPKAAVLHLYGQHFNYQDRYPPQHFPPEPLDLDIERLEALRYGRAAEYGVKILLDAAEVLDKQTEPAFLIFTSDHGENLMLDHTGKRYHAGPISGLNDTMVPALALWNKPFAETGRQRVLAELISPSGITHRDLANAWLHLLSGAPDPLAPGNQPITWGSLEAGSGNTALNCRMLKP